MTEKQLVLELGVEGGGANIFRTPVSSGGSNYHVEGSTIYLDENDDEGWRYWQSQPFSSITLALQSIAEDGSWVCWLPTTIGPDYQTTIWTMAQDAATKLPDHLKETWGRRRGEWQRQCHVKMTPQKDKAP